MGDPDVPMGVFLGNEADHNHLVTFLERDGDTLAGTCGITISRGRPAIGRVRRGCHATRLSRTRHCIPAVRAGSPGVRRAGRGSRLPRHGQPRRRAHLPPPRLAQDRGHQRLGQSDNRRFARRVPCGLFPRSRTGEHSPRRCLAPCPHDPSPRNTARLGGARRQFARPDDVHPLRRAELVHGLMSQVLRSGEPRRCRMVRGQDERRPPGGDIDRVD